MHIVKIGAILALNRTRSAANATEINYFVTAILTLHLIFTIL